MGSGPATRAVTGPVWCRALRRWRAARRRIRVRLRVVEALKDRLDGARVAGELDHGLEEGRVHLAGHLVGAVEAERRGVLEGLRGLLVGLDLVGIRRHVDVCCDEA